MYIEDTIIILYIYTKFIRVSESQLIEINFIIKDLCILNWLVSLVSFLINPSHPVETFLIDDVQ